MDETPPPQTLTAPDGRCRVDTWHGIDERTGPWADVRVVAPPGDQLLLAFSSRGGAPDVSFADGGELRLAWRDGWGRDWRLIVDVAARTFRTHPHDEPEPLTALPGRLAPPPRPRADGAWRIGFGMLDLLGCTALTAAGLWMALGAGSATERWIGALGALFFGVCLVLAVRDFWPGRRRDE